MIENKDYTILIVDDVPRNIQIVANILNSKGYKLLFSQSAIKSIEIVKNKEIDLILLDVMMPEMNGYKVCEEIKKIPDKDDIPVIFLTAKNDIESVKKGFQCGGVDFIIKPFNNEELVARVDTHLKLRKAFTVIQKQNEELQELNQTKDKFFSIIAHDLRNPFNAIYMMTEVLRRRVDDLCSDEAQQMIDLLYLSTKEIYELLDNLLTWSRLQRYKLEYLPDDINIKKLIENNLALYENIAKSKHIDMNYEVDEKLEMETDRNMLNTIIRNLLTNAIKFTNENGQILVSVDENDEFVIFSVKDTGIGMSEEELEKILTRSKVVSKMGTADERGTGIGLFLCMEFVEMLKGKMWIESEKGKGSTFFFTIKKQYGLNNIK